MVLHLFFFFGFDGVAACLSLLESFCGLHWVSPPLAPKDVCFGDQVNMSGCQGCMLYLQAVITSYRSSLDDKRPAYHYLVAYELDASPSQQLFETCL